MFCELVLILAYPYIISYFLISIKINDYFIYCDAVISIVSQEILILFVTTFILMLT